MSARDKLTEHFASISTLKLTDAFTADPQRAQKLSHQVDHLYVDLSRHRLTDETMDLLVELAKEIHLEQNIHSLFCGENINVTEQRPALHTALRHSGPSEHLKHIWQQVDNNLEHMSRFVKHLHSGKIRGGSGKPIDTIVHLGIGGSDLGPRLAVSALYQEKTADLKTVFVANIDPQEIEAALTDANPETTLFVVCSKSFTTTETLTNARKARQWLIDNHCSNLPAHFMAVTANADAAQEFGIAADRIFPMQEWVGGRYSVWSAVGLTVAANFGMEQFHAFLRGAHNMDTHFYSQPIISNIPALLGLIDCWYINYFKCRSLAVIPYDSSLALLPDYLAQLVMESNGKSVDREGNAVTLETSPVVWGGVGTNAQHAFMQLLHQGTQLVPVDFLVPINSRTSDAAQHRQLVANCLAQAETLMTGTVDQELPPWRKLAGNRPSTVIVYDCLSAEVLGMLLALYEHRTFVQACVWNINPFDQWGVEHGKATAGRILESLEGKPGARETHPATQALIDHFRKQRQ